MGDFSPVPDNIQLNPIYIFVKFGSKENLNKLREHGSIYMKRLGYYVEEERKSGNKGRGDLDEGVIFKPTQIQIFDYETGNLLLNGDQAILRDSDSVERPVYCMSCRNIYENIQSFEYPNIETIIRFDEKIIEDFSSDGEKLFALIICKTDDFIARLEKALKDKGLGFTRNFVKYRDTSILYRVNGIIEHNDIFCKNECFSHQCEYRIALEMKVEDYYEFKIGSLEDISVMIEASSLVSGIGIKMKAGELVPIE